ncbi:cation transporter [Acinetobacter baumannii]
MTVRAAINGVAGVKDVRVDFAAKTARVVFDDTVTNVDSLATASRNAGFPAARKE